MFITRFPNQVFNRLEYDLASLFCPFIDRRFNVVGKFLGDLCLVG